MSPRQLTKWDGSSPAQLRQRWKREHVYVYGRVASTNDVARALAEDGAPEGTVVIAREHSGPLRPVSAVDPPARPKPQRLRRGPAPGPGPILAPLPERAPGIGPGPTPAPLPRRTPWIGPGPIPGPLPQKAPQTGPGSAPAPPPEKAGGKVVTAEYAENAEPEGQVPGGSDRTWNGRHQGNGTAVEPQTKVFSAFFARSAVKAVSLAPVAEGILLAGSLRGDTTVHRRAGAGRSAYGAQAGR